MLFDVVLVLLSYTYIISIILFLTQVKRMGRIDGSTSRKVLHIMIGNLVFLIPFFSSSVSTVAVAAPFIVVTLLASPLSPFKVPDRRLEELVSLTEEGHGLGLVFYAVSYTVLAVYFTGQPHVIAAGILPMAYGDSLASIVGRRYGGAFLPRVGEKSLEGSIAMLVGSFVSLTCATTFFRVVSPARLGDPLSASLLVSLLASFVESVSPGGYDNILVPLPCALAFRWLMGGV